MTGLRPIILTMGRGKTARNRMKRNGTRAEREAYETLNCNLSERKNGAAKETDFVDQLLFGIVVVMIVGALLALGLK